MAPKSKPTASNSVTLAISLWSWFKAHPKFMVVLILLVLVFVVNRFNHRADEINAANQSALALNAAKPVVVAPVVQDKFQLYLFGLGVVTPSNIVEVRSRVEGQLLSLSFDEGQIVKAGDLLAQIDPLPFDVQLKLAKGQLLLDQTLLNKAHEDLARYQKLLKQDSTSLQLVENKQALVRQYQAAVQADQGRVTNAEMQLSFASIKAPIGGRLGFRQVDAGNIVRTSDPKGIVTLTQLDPISVLFSIPEDNLPPVLNLLSQPEPVSVELFDRNLQQKIAQGRLLAVDNQIDPTTGTIKLKAEFANSDGSLFANQFVNVRMALATEPQAILLPTSAIQRGSLGTFVYVVKGDQTVSIQPIQIAASQGEISMIRSGVSIGDKVVTEGADQLREGSAVKIVVPEKTQTPKGGL